MNLELTPNEYLALIKAIYLADCVANADSESTGMEHRDISRLRRKIFSRAEEAGFGDLVRHDPEQEDYFETEALAEEVDAEFMDRHIEMIFWREIRGRLTDKIMDERFGAEMTGWSDTTYKKHRTKIEAKVEAEIQANGLSNLFLLGDFS